MGKTVREREWSPGTERRDYKGMTLCIVIVMARVGLEYGGHLGKSVQLHTLGIFCSCFGGEMEYRRRAKRYV